MLERVLVSLLLYKKKNKRKWDKVKLTQGNTSCIRGLEDWDRHAIRHNEKGMGWSTLDLGISPRRGDAIICYLEKEKKKREKKEENERKVLRKRIVFVFILGILIYLCGVFDLWYENVSLKDSRTRWRSSNSSDRVWHARRNRVGFRFLGLFISLFPFL